MITAFHNLQIALIRQVVEDLPQFLHIAQRISRAREKKHWYFNFVQMRIPQFVCSARRMQRITEKNQGLHRHLIGGDHLRCYPSPHGFARGDHTIHREAFIVQQVRDRALPGTNQSRLSVR